MRTGGEFHVSPDDLVRLERLVADRNTPQKHVWRAQIVLLSAEGVGTMEIVRRTGQSKPTVWRGQSRFSDQVGYRLPLSALVGSAPRSAAAQWPLDAGAAVPECVKHSVRRYCSRSLPYGTTTTEQGSISSRCRAVSGRTSRANG